MLGRVPCLLYIYIVILRSCSSVGSDWSNVIAPFKKDVLDKNILIRQIFSQAQKFSTFNEVNSFVNFKNFSVHSFFGPSSQLSFGESVVDAELDSVVFIS